MTELEKMGKKAKEASRKLAYAGSKKDLALRTAAEKLVERRKEILKANEPDVHRAEECGTTKSLIDRLTLTEARIEGMAEAVREIAAEADPVGKVLDGGVRPNGLKIERVSVPLGVVGIIYESRPNVTSDAAALCIKSGNAVILRGGKEAYNSCAKIAEIFRDALVEAGLPADCVQLVSDQSHESVRELMGLTEYLDVLIPRGGAGLIKSVKENAKVPVIETGVGNCHIYVDESAETDMAAEIIFNAKTSRPSVCNAIETVLVHRGAAKEALPKIKARLDEKHVEIRADEETMRIIPGCVPACEEDWAKEFLDYILAVKVVGGLDEAIDHIEKYSSGHSEAIITNDLKNAERFLNEVDSAAVYVNASTRFTDGGEFGLGAEMGISTQKLHARGPMGLSQLTSYKYIIRGNGQVR